MTLSLRTATGGLPRRGHLAPVLPNLSLPLPNIHAPPPSAGCCNDWLNLVSFPFSVCADVTESSNTALAEAFGFAWYGGALEFGSNAGQGYGSAGYGSAGYASFNGDGNNYRFGSGWRNCQRNH